MMNRSSQPSSSFSDPYFSSQIMPFASLDQEDNSNSWHNTTQNPMNINFHPTAPNLFHHDTNNTALIPFYSSTTSPYMIKREDRHHHHHQLGAHGMNNIGLNLGHRTYFSSGDALSIDRLLSARAQHQHQHQHQPPRCQAEGCKADLSGAKHYHRRHKVCEFHSKATVVIAGGMQQRFCQQCSRFHVLGEFDESKRSCRKRLADHNRRRRKPHNNNNSSSTTTTNSSGKTKQCTTTPRPSRDSSSKCTTASNSGMEVNQGDHQSKGVLFRNGPALSLGGVDELGGGGSHNQQHQGFYDYQHHSHFSPSTSNTNTTTNNNNGSFYHQSLFGSSINMEASHHLTHDHHYLHLGQSMFEVDFM